MSSSPRSTRRDFLKAAAVSGAALSVPGTSAARAPRRRSLHDKLHIAVIGCGGKGFSDMQACARDELIVALCDVDRQRSSKAVEKHPKARFYDDYRDLFDREKELDAVVISTPDHSHAPPAVLALQRKLHLFVQKPLTHTIEEARVLTGMARQQGVITSMGNQGTAMSGLRSAAEIIRSGVLGTVQEVHVWTNRPIWPQGISRPGGIDPIPAHLRWDLWLGPAPYRPYAEGYCPFKWRGWWDFGTGALGDMGCHIMNLPYLALELGLPESVAAESGPLNDDSAPKWSVVEYRFPARGGRPPVKLTWYDGKKLPPADLLPGVKLRGGGSMVVGDEGTLYSPDDYGRVFELFPREKFEGYQPPAPTLPRSPGLHAEWLAGIHSGTQPMASFDYAGALTEAVLLGNVAVRVGEEIRWDAAAMKAVNCPAAEELVKKEYRRGFPLHV